MSASWLYFAYEIHVFRVFIMIFHGALFLVIVSLLASGVHGGTIPGFPLISWLEGLSGCIMGKIFASLQSILPAGSIPPIPLPSCRVPPVSIPLPSIGVPISVPTKLPSLGVPPLAYPASRSHTSAPQASVLVQWCRIQSENVVQSYPTAKISWPWILHFHSTRMQRSTTCQHSAPANLSTSLTLHSYSRSRRTPTSPIPIAKQVLVAHPSRTMPRRFSIAPLWDLLQNNAKSWGNWFSSL
jgi:hypothetical protein